ncbi:MAG: DUF808 family protein, partial [Pseudomonadota bacterium]
YLSFEGAEKVWHAISGHYDAEDHKPAAIDAAHLEEQRVKGAIKTDFILSAEIMTISLAAIETTNLIVEGVTLAVVAVLITTVVYGAVAFLVKADDIGLRLSQVGRSATVRRMGRGIVKGMPRVLTVISTIGTAAMLWVGGSIIVHGLHAIGWHTPYDVIYTVAESIASIAAGNGFVHWLVTAALDGVVGLALGLALMWLIALAKPVVDRITGRAGQRSAAHEP